MFATLDLAATSAKAITDTPGALPGEAVSAVRLACAKTAGADRIVATANTVVVILLNMVSSKTTLTIKKSCCG